MHSLFVLVTFAAAVAGPLDYRAVQLPEYSSIAQAEMYATPTEYAAAKNDTAFRLTQVSYRSDGLTVHAYVYAPGQPVGRFPVVVFNRGSGVWKTFAGEYLTLFHRLAQSGFVIVAPMYRGSGGASGRDELGGADLNDLMNVIDLVRVLPFADVRNIFLYGESRGGMMVYQAVRDGFPARAAAVVGAFTDLSELTANNERFAAEAEKIWPDYDSQRGAINARRSAIQWPDRLTIPILIMHGGDDPLIPPSQALRMASQLEALGKTYELVIRAGANHVLTEWRHSRDAWAAEWFLRHAAKN